ncbi:hypothetical protein [Enteractinococcus helveticum]|nr:hypothetical protein [Enteractinococcus helveticum]
MSNNCQRNVGGINRGWQWQRTGVRIACASRREEASKVTAKA